MNIIPINEYITRVQFPPTKSIPLGRNVYLIQHDNEVVLIDTGFEENMRELLPTIQDKVVSFILLTHYHIDHCSGLLDIKKDIPRIGSSLYHGSISHLPDDITEHIKPTISISEDTIVRFHNITFTLIPIRGHSMSDLLIDVNEEFLFIGDQLICTNHGEQSIPYASDGIRHHIDAIKHVQRYYSNRTLLPSHGSILQNKDVLFLEHTILYLDYLYQGHTSLDEFYASSSIRFMNDQWHKYNIP